MAQNVRYRNAICNLLQGDFFMGQKRLCFCGVFVLAFCVFRGLCLGSFKDFFALSFCEVIPCKTMTESGLTTLW